MTHPDAKPQTAASPSYDAAPPPAIGSIVWHDLMTTDRGRALAFYTELVGWRVHEQDMGPAMGMYAMLMLGEQYAFGGVVPLDPAHGMPSHWMSYADVDDIDAVCARVRDAGGALPVPPSPIPGVGRFAVLQDPTGAFLSVVQQDAAMPTPEGAPQPGMAWWHELGTTDPERAVGFYTAVFGWRLEDGGNPGGQRYWLLHRADGQHVGGMFRLPTDAPVPSYWGVYITVADLDAARARALALGATERFAPMDLPGTGRIAGFVDPTGAMFSLGQTVTA